MTDQQALTDLRTWQQRMQRKPSLLNRFTRLVQARLNALLPEKLHRALTVAIQKMVQGVLFGSTHTTRQPVQEGTLAEREARVRARIRAYRNTAAVEGGATGAGGFLLSLADFPLLLGIKLKLLFDIAALYGHDVRTFSERLYLLYIFQLAFSSQHTRRETYRQLAAWPVAEAPTTADAFDWRTFQQEYRDYIDLAKMAQLLPVVGAAVGAVANYRLLAQLGETAIMCYRLRWFSESPSLNPKPDPA
ncbi:ABC transporter-associated protein EcsC [Hymenobacter amundsenii]|uniref:ABC transporter-associated protein EcsC n=1 Tax=Hymenobacter amundsenii TaxID=2006685 RepID=A0A246FII2_9BACT|nr:EcsC family protein [Hymenobacter amundsenii]OWP62346.1 ABC transporter-associated protein EcsC [Hymenobacter amundsenii]